MIKTSAVARVVLVLALAAMASVALASEDQPSCAAAAEPTALKIEKGSGITPPKAIYREEPKAAATVEDGAIAKVAAIIGEDGHPRHICQMSGSEEWGVAVIEALQHWRFEPATLNGESVAVQFTLTTRLKRK